MTDKSLQKKANQYIAKDFRSIVTKLESQLKQVADGKNIIVGTKEKPIVTDSVELPIEHFFMEGVYIRKMIMREGVTVIGAIHKHLHMCFLTEGHVLVADEFGSMEYKAPCHIIAKPGVKRVLHALEDSVWYNTHMNPTGTNEVEEVEKNIVAVDYKKYDEYIKNK